MILAELTDQERDEVLERAEHVRELLTGYRSGISELARPGEPREQYDPRRPLLSRYEAKAVELGVGSRTLQRWVQAFRESGKQAWRKVLWKAQSASTHAGRKLRSR